MDERRMIPVLVGLDYRTAPLALRERLHADDERLFPLLATLRGGPLHEVIVLSTCNRYEVLATCDNPAEAQDAVSDCLIHTQDDSGFALADALYRRDGVEAVRHLFRVAAGLESLVLGETQIMRQIAEAMAQAREIGTSGPLLSRLFAMALHAGKRARTETAISQHTLSVSHAAAALVRSEMAQREHTHIVVVGAGEMATLAAGALAQHTPGAHATISIINRNDARAHLVAEQVGVGSHPWNDLDQVIANADAIITATSARQAFLRVEDIAASRTDNSASPLLVVDIGVPRNVVPAEQTTSSVRLFDIDDLQTVVAQHRLLREAEVAQVQQIVDQEVVNYTNWLNSRRIVPVLAELRGHADAIADAEMQHLLRRLPELDEHERDLIEQMARRIVNKLLHTPTVNLKWRAARGDHFDYAHAIRKMFALESPQPDAGTDLDDD